MPAISFEEAFLPKSAGPASPSDPGGAGSRATASDDGANEGATLLASVAAMLTEAAKTEAGRPARGDLIRKLTELERRLRGGSRSRFHPGPQRQNEGDGQNAGGSVLGQARGRAGAGPDVPGAQASGMRERLGREVHNGLLPSGAAPETDLSPDAPMPAEDFDCGGKDLLLQQIEAAHARLAGQLQVGFAAEAAEIGGLKNAVLSAIERVELSYGPRQSENFASMLEQVSAELSGRLDLAAASLAPLADAENRIGELSLRLDEMRGAIAAWPLADEQAAQKLLLSGEAAQPIRDEIADLRAFQEDAGRRAELAWASIQSSLDQVSALCARLENAMKERHAFLGPGTSPNDPFASLLNRYPWNVEGAAASRADGARGSKTSETQNTLIELPGNICGPEFLIEPGQGYTGQKTTAAQEQAVQPREDTPSRIDPIAAARRAAQMARREPAANLPAAQTGGASRWFGIPSRAHRATRFFSLWSRPISGAAALLALVLIAALILGGLGFFTEAGRFVPARISQFFDAPGTGSASGPSSGAVAVRPLVGASEEPAATGPNSLGRARKPTAAEKDASALMDVLAPQQGSPSSGRAAAGAAPAAEIIAGKGEVLPPPRRSAAAPAFPAETPLASLLPSGGGLANEPQPPQSASAVPNDELLSWAGRGDPVAQFELAARYAEDASVKGNLALAAQWYEKAASQGHAVAQYRLGSMYEKGRGVGKNTERARDLYQRAAEQGNVRAMHNLGVMAAEGGDGKPNYTSAALWFSKAAEYGIRDSQYNLAVLLARGLGVTKDLVRSYTWFAIVAAAGDAEAAGKRDEIAARLTSSELAAANAAAASYVPQTPGPDANEPLSQNPGQSAAKANAKAKLSGL